MSGYKSFFITVAGWIFFLCVGGGLGYIIGMSGPAVGIGVGVGLAAGLLLKAR